MFLKPSLPLVPKTIYTILASSQEAFKQQKRLYAFCPINLHNNSVLGPENANFSKRISTCKCLKTIILSSLWKLQKVNLWNGAIIHVCITCSVYRGFARDVTWSSLSGIALVFSVTQNTSETRKSFAIVWTNRFDKKSEVCFYRLPKATEKHCKWIAAMHGHKWTTGSETWFCSYNCILICWILQ